MDIYGVSVFNKFGDVSMFGDDDPYDLLQKNEDEKIRLKEEAKKAKEKQLSKAAKSKQNANKKAQAVQQEQKGKVVDPVPPRTTPDNRPPRIAGQQQQQQLSQRREGERDKNVKFSRDVKDTDDRRERWNNSRDTIFTPANEFGAVRSDRPESGRGSRGRGRGSRGDRGSIGRGGFDRNRQFDRHSGSDKTGIKPVEKRDGGGAHNWGTINDDVEAQMNDSNVSAEEGPVEWNPTPLPPSEDTENQDPNEGGETTNEDGEIEKEDECAKQMTLDEYKAMQPSAKPKDFNIRLPNEGCDMKQWKNTFVLKKKPNVNNDEEYEEDIDDEDKPHLKQLVNIKITFSDNPRRGGRGGRRGRGGRGAGGSDRGGLGRGAGAGGVDRRDRRDNNYKREIVPKVDDPLEFPSITSP